MKIADLFFGTHLDDMGITAEAGKLGDKAGATLGAKMSSGLKKASTGLLDGLKLGAGIAAFGALDTAISKTIGFLSDAVNKARADEESQNRLAASLRANVAGWNGNTDAIEKNILAKQRLGFDDETLRDSLTVLVGATHDVTKAQEIQNTAMDLARFKGIDLKTASEALIKVEAGQYRSLKQLGIQLPKNATQTQALAAVQAVAAGQAEAYANTSSGKLLASQIAVGEAMETLGRVIMPLVTDAELELAKGAVPVVEGLAGIIAKVIEANDLLTRLTTSSHSAGEDIDWLGSKTDPLGMALHSVADAVGSVSDQLDFMVNHKDFHGSYFDYVAERTAVFASTVRDTDRDITTSTANMTGAFRSSSRDMGRSITTTVTATKTLAKDGGGNFVRLRDASGNAAARIKENARDIATALKNLTATLLGQVTALINGYYDPIIAQDDLRVQKDQVAADTIARNATKSGTAERHQADLTLANSQKNLDQTRANLLASGDLSAKDQRAWLADLQKRYKTATGTARTEIGKLIAKIKELQGLSGAHVNITTTFKIGGKATGGPVTAGVPYYVNERTPNSEIWVPDVSGKVLSGAVPVNAAGGGVTNTTYNIPVTVAALPAARSPFQIASTLRRFAEDGVLAPEPVLR